jgi:hypothetical protein
MTETPRSSPSFRDVTLFEPDFTNATLRGGHFNGLRVTDAWIVDVELSGMIRGLVVNGVDVTEYVQAEMDRRLPERVLIRSMTTAADCRAGWDVIERLWVATIARVGLLRGGIEFEHVRGEWSFTETVRHLVFVVDAWAQRTILDHELPYHPLGWPHAPYPREDAEAIGLKLATVPTLDDAVAVWHDRCAVMRRIVNNLQDEDLDRVCTRTPAPGYPEDPVRTVGLCLHVVMDEALEHNVYANRDLDALEGRHTDADMRPFASTSCADMGAEASGSR